MLNPPLNTAGPISISVCRVRSEIDIFKKSAIGGGRVVRRCWVNFQCRGVLLIWITVEQKPIPLAVGAGGVVWTFFSRLSFLFSFLLSRRRPDIN